MPILAAVLSSYLAAAAALPMHRGAGRRTGTLLALFCLGLAAYIGVQGSAALHGGSVRVAAPWVPSLGVEWAFQLDGLSLLLSLVVCVVGAAVTLHASGYLAGHPQLGRFYATLMAFMASMLGLLLADNLLILFIFWELTSVTSYLLIGFKSNWKEARSAALMALLVTALGGLALLAGLLMLGNIAGTYTISAMVDSAGEIQNHALYLPALVLILIGAFTKSAQFPFHFWLPAAMTAPAPASAYLHAATMVKAGVYLLLRLLPVLGATLSWQALVAGTGLLTMTVGAVLAYREKHLKRILAYSTVSALGTMVFLTGIGTDLAVKAAVGYLLAHALYKGALFLVAGNVEHEFGTAELGKLGGLLRRAPWTASAAIAAGAGMAGLAPTLGFLGKENLLMASWEIPGAVWVVTAAAAVGIAVSGLVALRPFLGSVGTVREGGEAGLAMLAGPVALAAAGIVLGLLAPFTGRWLVYPAVGAITGVAPDKPLALWHGWTPELALSGFTIALGAALYSVRERFLNLRAVTGGNGWTGSMIYQGLLDGTLSAADRVTGFLQSGYLRRYLIIVLLTMIALVGYGVARALPQFTIPSTSGVGIYEAALALVVAVSCIAVALTSQRWKAIAALGVAGYGVGLIFLTFGAPDLALTQIVVETLVVVLFVFAMRGLPDYKPRSPRASRIRDGFLATGVGVVMTVLTLFSLQIQLYPAISDYFAQASVPEAYGRNIVNVILVDFRALDTLGEITVIATAALGVAALLRLRRRPS